MKTLDVTQAERLEHEIVQFGELLWRQMGGQKPGVFNKAYWSGRILEWAMRDAGFKVDLFRLTDVLPALGSAEEVSRHVREYLMKDGRALPPALEMAIRAASNRLTSGLASWTIRRNVIDLAHRFIVGRDVAEAIPVLRRLHEEGIGFTADLLGEATLSDREALACQARYLNLIARLAEEAARWPLDGVLDRNHLGEIPRVNISVKISALEPQLDPVDTAGCVARLKARLLPILQRARERNVFVNFDMEQWELHGITMDLFEELAMAEELRGWPHLGIVVQAYLKNAERDLERLLALARARQAPLTVRLVKGAYWDSELVRARQHGHPCPVLLDKAATDLQFERLTEALLANIEHLHPAFASHNLRSLTHAIVLARTLRIPKSAYEIQVLYGMAEPERKALRALGYRVRAYTPIGEMLPGMAYLVRRLLENTANSGFLRLTHHDGVDVHELLKKPTPATAEPSPRLIPRRKEFENCPLTDFTDPAARQMMGKLIAGLWGVLPLHVPIVVADKLLRSAEIMQRYCPSRKDRLVAEVSMATTEDAEAAIRAAWQAYPAWRDRPVEERARLLEKLADLLERDRLDLAALETIEEAKPWREADADVAEAIDFCRYYARQARQELVPHPLADVPGEHNTLYHEGRGPTAVIAPWNFPLAIPCGMMVAALVAGNPVLFKPAEQASAIGFALFERAIKAGFPPEVLHFLPGAGEVVGDFLARHLLVAQIAFTGSKEVGLKLIEAAAATQPGQPQVRRVICEMGGKNAIIVDDDADLDEAVLGVLHSAFGYAGQKCSAASRVIVVGNTFDLFVRRLTDACRSLALAPAHDPACHMGPVIDEAAYERLLAMIREPGAGARVIYTGQAPEGGWFVPPTLVLVSDPQHPIMRQEFFGPLVALMRVRDFEEALAVANASEYALTGSVYSRSPEHLNEATRRFRVGNLYLNRPSTGAKVGRQPFGGFAMSGLGAKAGGPGYLVQFAQPRCVSENTSRHGFTPEVDV